MISNSKQIVYFYRFMRLFDISLFSIISINEKSIHAIIAWVEDCTNGFPDIEETQEILWNFDEDSLIDDALFIGEYAFDANLISIDKILIDELQIAKSLVWDLQKVKNAFEKLLQLKVMMIDDGIEIDFFILHR